MYNDVSLLFYYIGLLFFGYCFESVLFFGATVLHIVLLFAVVVIFNVAGILCIAYGCVEFYRFGMRYTVISCYFLALVAAVAVVTSMVVLFLDFPVYIGLGFLKRNWLIAFLFLYVLLV